MRFTQPVRRLLLAVHLTASIGWVGTVVAYLALVISASVTDDPEIVRSAWIGMDLIGWYATVPLAALSLITGITMSVGTKWGLLRHYWVVMSLIGTVICTGVLVEHMFGIDNMTRTARTATADELLAMPADLFHPLVGGIILLGILVLNVYKPKGLTRRGWRQQQAIRADDRIAA